MSSVHRLPGKPNWICFFSDNEGKRRCKSTLTTDKREAQRICAEIQKLHDQARKKTLTPDKARKIIESTVGEIVASMGGVSDKQTIREYLEAWTKNAELENAQGTASRYKSVIQDFLEWLGPKAERGLSLLSSHEITAYRNALASRLASTSVNLSLKILRVALEGGVALGHFSVNPARMVKNIEARGSHKRRPFTIPELKQILKVAAGDWKTCLLIAIYTGQRLSDIANLAWSNVDFEHGEIHFLTGKTGRTVILPLAAPLKEHLESLPSSDDVSSPICPSLAGKPSSDLSSVFYQIMVQAGLAQVRTHKKAKAGRGAMREQSPLSFHSIRHSVTSLLKNAGVSEAIAMDVVGHDSAAVSRSYTKISGDAKRAAIEKLPDVTK